jgi:hypothetical protein
VTFAYIVTEELEQECITTGAPPKISKGFRTQTTGVTSTIAYDPRVKKQITGFNLTGLSGTVTEDEGWIGPNGEATGNACPEGSAPNGPVVVVEETEGLFVKYGSQSIQIWAPAQP